MTTPIDLGHIADVGSKIRLTVKDQAGEVVSLASATTLEIWFKKPDGTYKVEDGELYTDGTDGIVQYTFIAADLDLQGLWLAQVYVVFPASELHSTYYKFMIDRNLSSA